MSRVYGRGVISNRSFRNKFSNIRLGDMSLREEHKTGRSSDFYEDALRKIAEWNLYKRTPQ